MLAKKLKNYNIILASGSPRRQSLLRDLDIDFNIKLKSIEENYPKTLKAAEITDYLAELKSKPYLEELSENDILITSDTIVWLNDEALGKPKNYDEAFKMLSSMSNTHHEVITSVCISMGTEKKAIINDTVKVFFKKLKEEEIDYYIKEYKPFDKAGAYGIQEWIGKIGIDRIEGSYFTVMGFPVHKLYKELEKL